MTRKLWTSQEIDFVRRRYPHVDAHKLAAFLGRTYSSVVGKARDIKVCKTKAYKQHQAKRLLTVGAAYRFKKGMVPKNKGKKLEEFMSPEAIEASKKTRFKKGNIPHNTKESNGIIVDRVYGNGRIYKYIRLGVANWVPLHHHVWEQANGPIPDNHAVIFLDNNTENCNLKNLKCVSKAENMLRNSRHNYPEEIIPSMLLINQLETILKQKDNG